VSISRGFFSVKHNSCLDWALKEKKRKKERKGKKRHMIEGKKENESREKKRKMKNIRMKG
jgi:hypothetical protein